MVANANLKEGLEVDLAIVGGGLVGASLCLALENSGFSVALIESHNFQNMEKESFDARSIALSLSSVNFFKHHGLWPQLLKHACAMKTIHVSEKGNFGRVKLSHQDFNVEALGFVIELHALNYALHQRLSQQKHTHLLTEVSLESVQQKDTTCLQLKDKQGRCFDLRSKLLIAADGANSSVRRLLGLEIDLQHRDFNKAALVCNVGLKRSANGVAYERFTESGPLALLPLPNQRAALVWSLELERAKALKACDEAHFLQTLQESFGYRLGKMVALGRRALFPLKASRMQTLVFDKTIFIGNAAQSLHPIAGQGFNLALRDVAHLSELIETHGLSEALLSSYALSRANDRRETIELSEGLLQSFMSQSGLSKTVRASAMSVMDFAPPLKRLLIRKAGGLAGKVPKMMYPY